MRKKFLIIWLLILYSYICSQSLLAYEPDFSSFDQEWLFESVKEVIPQGWQNYWVEIEKLDQTNVEYIIVNFQRRDPSAKVKNDSYIQNQLAVLQMVGADLELVWKSDIFYGKVNEITFEDIDNNGRMNINIRLQKEENNKFVGLLRIYDWNGANTSKIYPEEYYPELLSRSIRFCDADNDGDIEIFVEKDLTVEVYLFKNNQLILEESRNCSVIMQLHSKERPVSEVHPEVNKIVTEENLGILKNVIVLSDDKIYLVELTSGKESEYAVIFKAGATYKYWYKLDKRFASFEVSTELSKDLNDDGYFDLVLVERYGLTDVAELYYIISLRPDWPQLISPVEDEFVSSIWRFSQHGGLGVDCNGLSSDIFYNDVIAIQYWRWSELAQCYTRYQIKYIDKVSGQEIIINN